MEREIESACVAADEARTIVAQLWAQVRGSAVQRAVLWVRDYFVYKDMYNPNADDRAELLASGRRGQDAFLLLTKALEARARALGRLRSPPPAAGGAPWWHS